MKTKLSIFSLFISLFSFSQTFEFGAGLGTGSTYIVENSDKSVNVNYKTPTSIYTDLKYTASNSNFGILLRYHYTNTSVSGQKWFQLNQDFNANVNENTLFLLLEYLKKSDQKLNFGGNIGIGYTKQIIDFNSENEYAENSFPSINLSGIIDYNLNSKLSLKLQPSFQFFDPINAMKIESYNFAKEDIHFLALLGISYKLVNK